MACSTGVRVRQHTHWARLDELRQLVLDRGNGVGQTVLVLLGIGEVDWSRRLDRRAVNVIAQS